MKKQLKTKPKKYTTGGAPEPWIQNQGSYYNSMPSEGAIGANTNIGITQGWEGFGNTANLMKPQGQPSIYSPTQGYQQPTRALDMDNNQYSIDSVRKEEGLAKYGGKGKGITKNSNFDIMAKNKKQMGGGVMPQFMPPLYPTGQPVRIEQPQMAMGGHLNNGMYFNGKEMVKANGSGTWAAPNYYMYGGLRAGNQYPQYTDNPVPFPAKYGGLRAGNEYPQYIDNPVPFPAMYGGYPDTMAYGGLRAGNEYPQYVDNPVPFSAQMGGYPDQDGDIDMMKDGGKKNWIKGAVNPAHKGYCTPMTKSTCTPKRKAFAETMKKHHGFHKEYGGTANPFHPIHNYIPEYADGGMWDTPGIPQDVQQGYDQTVQTSGATPMQVNTIGQPMVTGNYTNSNMSQGMVQNAPMAPTDNTGIQQPMATPVGKRPNPWVQAAPNLLGAAMLSGQYLENQHYQKDQAQWQRQHGLTDAGPKFNNPLSHGTNVPTTYSQTPSLAYSKYGGGTKYSSMGGYVKDSVHELSDTEIQELTRKGYKLSKA